MKQLSRKKEFILNVVFSYRMYVYKFFKMIYLLMVIISLWAIILHNMSQLIISCVFLSESKY